MDTCLEFFEALWPLDLPGELVLWCSDTKQSTWCKTVEEAAKKADKLSQTQNVFVGMGIQSWELAQENKLGAKRSSTRGSEKSVMALPGFYMDIDIAGDGHKEEKLPPTVAEALALVNKLPLQPTLIVHTGGGIHAHWLFNEAWELEEQDERDIAKQLLTRLQFTIQTYAKEHNWELDSTYDLARVLRPVGTFNQKTGTPRPVIAMEYHPERRYNPGDFDGILLETTRSYKEAKRVEPNLILAGIAEGSRDTELFRYAASLRARGIPLEEAEILVCTAAAACTPPIDRDIAIEKVRSAWKYEEGSERTQAKEAARDTVAQITSWDPNEIFTEETIGALATIREADETEYQRIKNGLRKKISVRDLDGAVKREIADRKAVRLVENEQEPKTPLEEILKDLPVKGLRKPCAWNVNENGVHQAGENGVVRACSVPVVLTGMFDNIDTGEERVGISWVHDGGWRTVVAEGSIVFGNPGILQLRKKGLPVSSANAKDLILYLTELEYENKDTLPRQKSVSHLGWVNKTTFFPGVESDIVLDLSDGLDIMAHAYRPQGHLEDWQEMIKPLREYPLGRFVLASSFASALLDVVKHRVFLLHAWGSSTIGKSASMKAALSVWGDAGATITNFNSTKVALERMANMRGSLPLGVDERQVLGDKQGYIDSLVYMLGAGKGRERGVKTGGMDNSTGWNCVVMTNGEQPLTDESSNAGLKTRCLEITGQFVGDMRLADRLHQDTSTYFGTAGPHFIRSLIASEKDDPKWIEVKFEIMKKTFTDEFDEMSTVHAGHCAVVCMGDYLSSRWIWGLEDDEAWEQALNLGRLVMNQMETVAQQRDDMRSYNYFSSWAAANAMHFLEDPPLGKWFGMIDGEYIYVFPHIFKTAMKDGNFSGIKATRDWLDKGLMKGTTTGDKIAARVQKKHPVLKTRDWYYAIKRTLDDPCRAVPPDDDDDDW